MCDQFHNLHVHLTSILQVFNCGANQINSLCWRSSWWRKTSFTCHISLSNRPNLAQMLKMSIILVFAYLRNEGPSDKFYVDSLSDCSSRIIYKNIRHRSVARMEDGRTAFKILTYRKAKFKEAHGRSSREDNIRMDLTERGINTMNWVLSAQDKDYWRVFVDAALNFRVS